MEFSEKWGTDVETAVNLALQDLKLTIDEVDVTVLEEPSRGFFGIGAKLALVRVEKKKPVVNKTKVEVSKEEKFTEKSKNISAPNAEKAEKVERVEKPKQQEKQQRNVKAHSTEKNKEKVFEAVSIEVPDDLVPCADDNVGLAFLHEVTEKMGLTLEISGKQDEENLFIDIQGKESGTVIGKRGQTLDAIQYLTSLVVNKGQEKYVRVVVDAENYRSKREKTLVQLANRLADKVYKTGKSVKLEPMNPYERKVIHATLQSNLNVTTRSEGKDPYRRVIIELK